MIGIGVQQDKTKKTYEVSILCGKPSLQPIRAENVVGGLPHAYKFWKNQDFSRPNHQI